MKLGLLLLLWFVPSLLFGQSTQPASAPASLPGVVSSIEIFLDQDPALKEEDIRALLSQQVGATLDEAAVQSDIKSLFALGGVLDVQVDLSDDGVLVYRIQEWPRYIDYKVIGKRPPYLEDSDFIPRRYFYYDIFGLKKDKITLYDLKKSEQEVQDNLKKLGYLKTTVSADFYIEDFGYEQKLIVNYYVDFGDKYLVRNVFVSGNENITSKKIYDLLVTKAVSLKRKQRKFGQFSEALLENDILLIKTIYIEKGYLDVSVDKKIKINTKEHVVDIDIEIKENYQYKTRNVFFKDDLVLSNRIKSGDIYQRSEIRKYVDENVLKYQNQGYANAVIFPEITPDKNGHFVDIVMMVDKGPLFYFGDIIKEIEGKDESYDSLISFKKGELYSAEKIEKTRKRFENKEDFGRVEISTELSETPNVLNVRIVAKKGNVAEGRFLAAAALEDASWLYHRATLTNAFDHGNIFESQYRLFRDEQSASIGLFRALPYGQKIGARGLFVGPVARDYATEGDPTEDDRIDAFDIVEPAETYRRLGGQLFVQQKITKSLSATLQYSLFQQKEISALPTFPDELTGAGRRALLSAGLVFDNRDVGERGHEGDSGGFASKGWYLSAEGKLSASWLGSTADFAGVGLRGVRFFSLKKSDITETPGGVTLKLIGRFDAVTHLAAKEVPYSERYLLGGMGYLRGFALGSVGPTTVDGAKIGGTVAYGGTAELELPLVGAMGTPEWHRVRWAVFVDGAAAIGGINPALEIAPGKDFGVLPFRTSAGVSVRWYTSFLFGPVRFDLARPLDAQPGEGVQAHFSISTEL